ncbi:retinoid-binding protein 7 [Stegastes partitus]|uniref:Cellular retinoic acid-binding protein 1 n=1 Tax=Stegastes partitus TaxID=144197 RepID=A0A3B4ZH77_9TELE|nr:PREDICTED: retinoid-binding protein 7-like [Stegastes partitus]
MLCCLYSDHYKFKVVFLASAKENSVKHYCKKGHILLSTCQEQDSWLPRIMCRVLLHPPELLLCTSCGEQNITSAPHWLTIKIPPNNLKPFLLLPSLQRTSRMPADYSGTWDIVSNVNFEAYMVSLGIDFATRKVASMLKPQKVIKQDGDSFNIQTFTTFRNYELSFKIGEEFKEVTKGMDNRSCQTVVNWDGDKLVCVQRGEKRNRGWKHWIQGDELHLELTCEDQVCKQIFKRTL